MKLVLLTLTIVLLFSSVSSQYCEPNKCFQLEVIDVNIPGMVIDNIVQDTSYINIDSTWVPETSQWSYENRRIIKYSVNLRLQ